MNPTWESGDIQLYLGDCLDVLPTLEAESMDAVITDPPYGIDFKYGSGYEDSPDLYAALIRQLVKEANRLIGDGPVFVWQAMLNCAKWHEWFPPDFRIFAACKSFTQRRPIQVQYCWDPVIFWGTPKTPIRRPFYPRDYHEQRKAPFGKNRPNYGHPCPRPLEQTEYIVELSTLETMTILDPFMGSGTTGVACVKTGRKFIGIEIDEGYFEIAKKRIQEAQMQPRLERLTPARALETLPLFEEGEA